MAPAAIKRIVAVRSDADSMTLPLTLVTMSPTFRPYFSAGLPGKIFSILAPTEKLALLDETDSGLDIDALKIVSDGVNRLRGPDRSMVVITHYQRLLDHIVPDVVHVLSKGRIVKTGGKELALELEASGYAQFEDAA